MRDHREREKNLQDYFRISVFRTQAEFLNKKNLMSKQLFLGDRATHSGIALLFYYHNYYYHINFLKTVNCLKCEDGLTFLNLKDEKREFISKEKEYKNSAAMRTFTAWDFTLTSFLFKKKKKDLK